MGGTAGKSPATRRRRTKHQGPIRIDIHHDVYLGQPQRTIHVPFPAEVDGCHTFKYSERGGRYGNALPEGATEAEERAFKLLNELKYVGGVDEISPDGHAIDIRFGRVHHADSIMPEILKIIFRHFGLTHVILSFWADSPVTSNTWVRIAPPYELEVPEVTIEALPEAEAETPHGSVYLQLHQGRHAYTVHVAGELDPNLSQGLTNLDQPITVTGIQVVPSPAAASTE